MDWRVLNMNTIKIVDVATGTDIEREMTEQEILELEEQQQIAIAELQTAQAEAETKAAAKSAIADRLGLTADELQVLLG